MESDAYALRTAIFVILGVLLIAIGWAILRKAQGDYNPYIVISNESVSGLSIQSTVHYKGVDVGHVQDIFFDENDYDRVHILIYVNTSIPVAENTYAQLVLRGITGEYDLRLDNDGPLGTALLTRRNDPAQIEMRSEFISKIGDSLEYVLADISHASKRISALLSDDNQAELSRMLVSVSDAAEQLSFTGNQLRQVSSEIPKMVNSATATLSDYQRLANQLTMRTQGIEQAIVQLTTAGESIETLASRLNGDTLNDAQRSLASVDRASEALTLLLEDLRQDPQRVILGAPARSFGPGEQIREVRP